jgi:integrase
LEDEVRSIKSHIATDDDLPAFFGAPSAQVATPVTISTSIGPECRQFPANGCTFRNQSARWMWLLRNSKRKQRAPSTLVTFESGLRTIFKNLDPDTRLAEFTNASMRDFIARISAPHIVANGSVMQRKQLKAASVQQLGLILRLVIASARDQATGDRLFNPQWDSEFIDIPKIGKQKQPTLTREQIETLCKAPGQYGMIFAFLAGTGLRVSEMQAVRISGNNSQSTWTPAESVVIVRNACFRNKETGRTKTESGRRRVLVCSELNRALIAFVDQAKREDGDFLFRSKEGPVRLSTLRDRLSKIIPGTSPHAFRRWRNSHLIASRVLGGIVKAQMGHSKSQDMSELYNFQDETTVCREQIEAAGLGFQIGDNSNA